MTVAGLAWNQFSGETGRRYEVAAGGGRHAFVLEKVLELPDSGREGGSFRLEFSGPREPLLPQGTYSFESDGTATAEIFIVPIAQSDTAARYEAIFY